MVNTIKQLPFAKTLVYLVSIFNLHNKPTRLELLYTFAYEEVEA